MARAGWGTGLLAILFAAACDPESAVEVGVIDYHGESEDVIVVPPSVAVGQQFAVTVNTYGGGCDSAESMSIEAYDEALRLTPYDREDLEHVCAAVLRRLEHTAEIEFLSRGSKTLIVRGRRVDEHDDTVIELTYPIMVE